MDNQNTDPGLEALRITLKELNTRYFKTDSRNETKVNGNYHDKEPDLISGQMRYVGKEMVFSPIIIAAAAILVGLLTLFWMNRYRR